MIYHVRGTELACFHKGLGQRVAIVGPRYGEAVKRGVTVRAHLVGQKPGEGLQISVNGADWHDMSEHGRLFYRTEFAFAWDTASVPDGLVQLRVRSSQEDEICEQPVVVGNGNGERPRGTAATLEFEVGTVIGAPYVPEEPVSVVVNNHPVGVLAVGARGPQSFRIPTEWLRNVTTLRFAIEKEGGRISLTEPRLLLDGKPISDPLAAAIHAVRANHWSAGTVARAGFVVGADVPETSFALRRDTFVFVLP